MLTVEARVAARDFEVSLSVAQGETVAILGPNGAGKSTLLDVIAGLVRPDSGRAELDGRVLFDLAGRRPSWTPPHGRGVSLLAQQPLLFPHMSVVTNVAFGPRSAGAGREESHEIARHWLAEVDGLDLADRRPGELSGGQGQRIAVARALASRPRLLLLDEPLAALDVAVAPQLRRMLRRVLDDRTAIVVTHDVLDAFTLADRVVIMHDGAIIEQGPTREVLERPRNPFTADLAALNLITGTRSMTGLLTPDGIPVTTDSGSGIAPGTAVAAAVRPAAVSVFTGVTGLTPPNLFRLTVQDLEPRGDLIRVRAGRLSADVPPGVVADLDLSPGTEVCLSFDPAAVLLYPLTPV
jgi:molybdate transport system ATP-binding protein